jgi:heme/copper-type cytochrome/quinol oxidase subunit 2
MNIHNTPSFNVDVSTLPKNLLQGSDINETWKLFIFSWWWVGIALVVLFILVRFIRGFFTKKQDKPTNIVPPTIVVPPST